ncbi:hypothetical protein AOCH_004160 [Aspergillus ochraceoroseus]|uniref:Enoyl reductase (ER) domain-containing protein n=1 Tax=Aspergillus ochraceoroseus TaxID=138278 RepID=A0A0F8UJP2_9EURO|nr:hypothetical protein AOCH_004160 [Aspergillus ochraceoroseus]
MKAARYYKAGDVRIEDVPRPEPSHDKVLVAVEWCGICGSDLNEYLFGPIAVPSEKNGRHRLTGDILPVTMGHEVTGRIIHAPTTPSSSNTLITGQAVVIDPRFYCSSCAPCIQSVTNCCDDIGFLGLSGGGGGLSEVVAVPESMVHVLPENVDLAAAALIEPLAVAWHAVRLGTEALNMDLGDVPILVVGAGPVGVATVFVLKACGARMVFVSEPSDARRESIQRTGLVCAAWDPAEVDVAAKCNEVTGGGVGLVFDCAGSQDALQAGAGSIRFRGIYVNLAVPKMPITLPILPFLKKEITYKCSLAYDQEDFKQTVAAFVAGRFEGVETMISRRVLLDEIVEKGFKELTQPNNHIKILATPRVDLLF